MRCDATFENVSRSWPKADVTGNSVTSSYFEARDGIVYDKGVRLTYLHYIGVSSRLFEKVCSGENLDFPYRDVFLHHRYLHEPEKRPKFLGKPKPYNQPPNLVQRTLRKLGLTQAKSCYPQNQGLKSTFSPGYCCSPSRSKSTFLMYQSSGISGYF